MAIYKVHFPSASISQKMKSFIISVYWKLTFYNMHHLPASIWAFYLSYILGTIFFKGVRMGDICVYIYSIMCVYINTNVNNNSGEAQTYPSKTPHTSLRRTHASMDGLVLTFAHVRAIILLLAPTVSKKRIHKFSWPSNGRGGVAGSGKRYDHESLRKSCNCQSSNYLQWFTKSCACIYT